MAKSKNAIDRRRAAVASKTASTRASAVPSAVSSAYTSRASSPEPCEHFRFLDLPAELRVRIYENVLIVKAPLDLDSYNYRRVYPRLALFLVSRQVHEEAYRVFYAQSVRLFPLAETRFFYTKKPLLARLSPRYRKVINTAELVLGPGWTSPPKCQCISSSLGLEQCTSLRTLKIFVTCDPSDSFYNGFRGKDATEDTYKWFCVDLLQDFIDEVPSLETVQIDAYPGIKKEAPLITGLVRTVREARLRLRWGPLRGWDQDDDELAPLGLDSVMTKLSLGSAPRFVGVVA